MTDDRAAIKLGAEIAAARMDKWTRRIVEAVANAAGQDGVDQFLTELYTAKVRTWTTTTKRRNTEGVDVVEQHENVALELSPKWEHGPEWPPVNPPNPQKITPTRVKKPARNGLQRGVFLPDPQIGWWVNYRTGVAHPMHDPGAIDIALQIAADAKPDWVVWLGDMCDFAEFSAKFIQLPTFAHTAQATINTANAVLAATRHAVGYRTRIAVVGGNHDDRLQLSIIKNAQAAFGLTRPGQHWPALSMAALLNVDAYDADYVPGYPAGELWLRDHTHGPAIAVEHGRSHNVAKRATNLAHNVILGHGHHPDMRHNTIRLDAHHTVRVHAVSPGCLSRVDGFVPSTNAGIDEHGLPVHNAENWGQAVTVADWHTDGGTVTWTQIPIENHEAHWGRTYRPGRYWTGEELDGVPFAALTNPDDYSPTMLNRWATRKATR